MTMITASIEVNTTAFEPGKVPKPQLNLDWFMRVGKDNITESVSLNGGKLVAISIEQGKGKTYGNIVRYGCHLSFASSEDANKAFRVPVYKVIDGVTLHLSGLDAAQPDLYRELEAYI